MQSDLTPELGSSLRVSPRLRGGGEISILNSAFGEVCIMTFSPFPEYRSLPWAQTGFSQATQTSGLTKSFGLHHYRQILCHQSFAASCPSLCSVFTLRFLSFQQLTASFCKVGGYPLNSSSKPIRPMTLKWTAASGPTPRAISDLTAHNTPTTRLTRTPCGPNMRRNSSRPKEVLP